MSISVVINTRNEEENIERAIRSVKEFVDQVVVVDMESTDKTVQIAKKLGATVYNHTPTQYVEPARNYAIKKASSEWILILDADEEVPKELAGVLTKIAKEGLYSFVRIPRKNIIFGKWMQYARWWPDYNIRFFKKGLVTWDDEIHSIPITQGEGITLPNEESHALIHHHYQTVEQYLERLNRYTSIQAQNQYKKQKQFTASQFITRPVGEFLSRYFAGKGYKDGMHGLALSILQGFSEAVVMIKLWQLHKFKEKEIPTESVIAAIKDVYKDLNYWMANTQVEEGAGLVARIKRKFRLP